MISAVCLWRLKNKEQPWFWSSTCLGHIRVEFFKIFNDLDQIDGVSYDALIRIILTIDPWKMDDSLIKVLLQALYKIGRNKIDIAIVQALQDVPHVDRRLPYEFFLTIVSHCDFNANQDNHQDNPLHQDQEILNEPPFEIVLSDFEIEFMLDQTVANIPHLAILWSSSFGTARYRWIAKHHKKIGLVPDTLSGIILSSDWGKSTIPEIWFKSIIMLVRSKTQFPDPVQNNSQPYELSFTVIEFFDLVSLFTNETVASNWSCLLSLLDHVYVPSEDFTQVINKDKIKRTLKTFETACKNFDITTITWRCAIRVMSMFPRPIIFFEGENIKNSSLSKKFDDYSRGRNGMDPALIILSRTESISEFF